MGKGGKRKVTGIQADSLRMADVGSCMAGARRAVAGKQREMQRTRGESVVAEKDREQIGTYA